MFQHIFAGLLVRKIERNMVIIGCFIGKMCRLELSEWDSMGFAIKSHSLRTVKKTQGCYLPWHLYLDALSPGNRSGISPVYWSSGIWSFKVDGWNSGRGKLSHNLEIPVKSTLLWQGWWVAKEHLFLTISCKMLTRGAFVSRKTAVAVAPC